MKQTMKRLMTFILCVAIFLSLLPMGTPQTKAYSETDIAYPVEGGNIYFDKETGTITGADKTITSANIPAEIDSVVVTSIGTEAFSGCILSNLQLPESIVSFGSDVFFNCYNLTNITIPKNVVDIRSHTFNSCQALETIKVDEANPYYSSDADGILYDKEKIRLIRCPEGYSKTYEVPDSVTTIDPSAFYYCRKLISVKIPASVTSIGEEAFYYCSNLDGIWVDEYSQHYCSDSNGILFDKKKTELIRCPENYSGSYAIPDSVTKIANNAFSWCFSLTNVSIPIGVTHIGDNAFYRCTELKSIKLPSSVTSIGEKTFSYCRNLNNIKVAATNEWYSSDEFGILFNKTKTELIQCPGNYSGGYTIPDSVTIIRDWAFYDCIGLTSIEIPETTSNIGNHAFDFCFKLRSVVIPDSVTNLGSSAFSWCFGLTSVTISNNIAIIGDSTFAHCSKLRSITIPERVTSIGDNAFYSCDDLTSIIIPFNVKKIGKAAFANCEKLTGIWVDELNQFYSSDENGVLFNKEKTELIQYPDGYSDNYTVPDFVISIGSFAFYWCYSLTNVTIPDSVTSIGDYAFSNSHLTSVTIPDSVTSIGDCAFDSCYSLTSVTIGNGVTSIGYRAFDSCFSLTDAYYNGSAEEWNKINGNCVLHNVIIHFAHMPSEESTEPSEEPSEPSEESTDPSEEPSEPSEESTDPSEEPSEPSEEPSEPSEEPSEPSEEPSEPSEEPSEPSEPEIPTENPFTDVKENDYFATPVLWAVGKNITNGMSATIFAPNANCTRGQIVTFLWRACGSPEPTSTKNNFKDVKAGEYYYKAVLWAVENGITTGLSATSFGPNATCTRGQVATFLWRSQGEPAPESTNNPFSDVKTNDYYFNAVLWAVENNVTQGVGGGKFAPNASCTRGQIVTFLYRAIA